MEWGTASYRIIVLMVNAPIATDVSPGRIASPSGDR